MLLQQHGFRNTMLSQAEEAVSRPSLLVWRGYSCESKIYNKGQRKRISCSISACWRILQNCPFSNQWCPLTRNTIQSKFTTGYPRDPTGARAPTGVGTAATTGRAFCTRYPAKSYVTLCRANQGVVFCHYQKYYKYSGSGGWATDAWVTECLRWPKTKIDFHHDTNWYVRKTWLANPNRGDAVRNDGP